MSNYNRLAVRFRCNFKHLTGDDQQLKQYAKKYVSEIKIR